MNAFRGDVGDKGFEAGQELARYLITERMIADRDELNQHKVQAMQSISNAIERTGFLHGFNEFTADNLEDQWPPLQPMD